MGRFLIFSFDLVIYVVLYGMLYLGSALACLALWFMIIGNGGATIDDVPGFSWYLRSLPLFVISSVGLILLLEYFRINALKVVLWVAFLSIVSGVTTDDPRHIRNGNKLAQTLGVGGHQNLESMLSWLFANWAISIMIFGFLEHDRRNRGLKSETNSNGSERTE